MLTDSGGSLWRERERDGGDEWECGEGEVEGEVTGQLVLDNVEE